MRFEALSIFPRFYLVALQLDPTQLPSYPHDLRTHRLLRGILAARAWRRNELLVPLAERLLADADGLGRRRKAVRTLAAKAANTAKRPNACGIALKRHTLSAV